MPRTVQLRAAKKRTYVKRKVYRKKTTNRLPMWKMPRQLIPETKRVIDNSWTAETLDDYKTGWSSNGALLTIGEGADINQRTGDKVFSQGLYFNLHIEGSSGTSYNNCRIDVIEDSMPAATFPGFTDVYYTQSSGLTLTDALSVPINPQNIRRFKILKTMRFCLNNYVSSVQSLAGTSVASPGVKNVKFYIKTNKALRYGGTGSIAPYAGKRYILTGWSDVSANTPKVWATVIHRYIDLG